MKNESVEEENDERQPVLRNFSPEEVRSEFRLRFLKENTTGFFEVSKDRALTGAELCESRFMFYF
jgi:hypothetical protein